MANKRVNVKAILADAELRRQLMVSTIQATQAREGIATSREQADRAYYVVTEAERATFFELEPFKGEKRGERDHRHEMFVSTFRPGNDRIRHDVARGDFNAIDGRPLAYERVGIIAPIFREQESLEPKWGEAKLGAHTSEDERLLRYWWEVLGIKERPDLLYVPFAKGGPFSRFYSDVFLCVAWDPVRGSFSGWFGRIGRSTERPEAADHYFRGGLTWPRRTQRGFNLRVLPEGCIFADKGPAIFPKKKENSYYILGIANSAPAEFLLKGLMSFGSWEVGVVKRLPIPKASTSQAERVAALAQAIHDAKQAWDQGNEVSTSFRNPWALRHSECASFGITLDLALASEMGADIQIQAMYDELNSLAFRLYGFPPSTCAHIEESLGERASEVIWPQMEGKTVEQKRMEHVWRLLSYVVKRVVDADDDGIVPFSQSTGETRLVDRVRHELALLFPGRNESQLEVEIVNELKRGAKGYRKCTSLDDWLANAWFEYHVSLYKSRPIYWHIASSQGSSDCAFGALVHYHRFDKNRMAKMRASYMRDTIEELRRDAGLADKAGRADDRIELQARLEEAQALDRKLQLIQEGHHEGTEGGERDYRILTPWKAPNARPKGWDPDLDDGVKVNIAPLERAGVLRVTGIIR